jgi:hypothetical protein
VSEKLMRKKVVAALRSLHAVSIENGVGAGFPDIEYAFGVVELKSVSRWPPKGGPLRISHFTPIQRVWLMTRCRAGGRAFVLLKVKNDWILLDGAWAAQFLGKVTKDYIFADAIFLSTDGLDEKGLLRCLSQD